MFYCDRLLSKERHMTQDTIKKALCYDPDTGIFTWRYAHAGVKAGQPVYLQKKDNTYKIKFQGKKYPAPRLAWLYMYGTLPEVVSHINGDTTDNRICNLQDCSPPTAQKQTPPEMTAEYLRSIIIYDAETGKFYWKIDRAENVKAGAEVFQNINTSGYKDITTSGRTYRAHRLAWLYTYGEWPKVIDHINGDRQDNRICNLRSTTQRGNTQNMKHHREGRLVGASYVKHIDKWVAQIYHKEVNGRVPIVIGYYKTEQEAHDAYMTYCEENNLH